jgi:putative flippase GtrA
MQTTFRTKDLVAAAIAGVLIGLFILMILPNLSIALPVPGFAVVIFMALASVAGIALASLIARSKPFVLELAKFALVGGLNTVVDFGILNGLMGVTGVTAGWGFSLFKSVSFIAALVNSYLWNTMWTFKTSQGGQAKTMLSYVAVSGIGYLVNVGLASLVVNYVPNFLGTSPALWANGATLVAIVASMAWNFTGYKFFVFRDSAGVSQKA